MRKNYFYFVILFLFSIISFGQKVTLTPTNVNGGNVNTGPINLASIPYSTVSLVVKVEIPDGAAVSDQGTIKIYYVNATALGANVTIGGDGGALYFGGGKVATRSFVINLNWGDFLTSGGYLYAEYKNSNSPSGASFKSNNIAVIKNTTMTTGTTLNPPSDAPNPTKIPNTLCCNQTIRLGDKPAPITASTYLNPYQGEPYGINSSWVVNGNGSVRFLDYNRSNLNIDYVSAAGNFTVTRGLGYNYGGQYPNKSSITIAVVPSPITSNEITIDAGVNSNGFVEIINTNPKRINGTSKSAQVNLNILQDPFYVAKRGDATTNIEKFEWEYTKTNIALGGYQNWTTISGQNNEFLEAFTPSDISNTEDNYYLLRRIAIYQNIKRVSNTIKIALRTIRKNNTICCDQTLIISASNTIESPSTIIGSDAIPELTGYLKYQWQNQTIDSNTNKLGNWTNINGATSKDFLPPSLQLVSVTDGRTRETKWTTPTTYNYRRLTVLQNSNGESSYSNEIKLTSSSYIYASQNPIIIYPNPASSTINIQNNGTTFVLSNTPVSIVNIIGAAVVNPSNFSITTPNIMTADISYLPIGTYFIIVDIGGNRSYSSAFFKNN